MSGGLAGGWLVPIRRDPAAPLRLFCFSHAGSGAGVYRSWASSLPPGLDAFAVQLPGREERWAEPAYPRLPPTIGALASALRPYLLPPFAFFGHSMGALIAFELSRQLQDAGEVPPVHLVVSGWRGPGLPVLARGSLPQDVDGLRAWLRAYAGTDEVVLENAEVLRFLLPTVQADYRLCMSYRYVPGLPLACPLTALGGSDDPGVSLADLQAWQNETTGAFAAHQCPGGHFYLKQHPEPFFAALRQIFAPDLLGRPT